MANSTEIKDGNCEFHRAEQDTLTPLTVQPRKKLDGEDAPAHTLGYKPTQVFCAKCKREVTTNLTFHITDMTHLSVFLCSVATWPCLACFLAGVPYCLTQCHEVDHRCPHCKTLIGKQEQFNLAKICRRKK